MVNGRSNLCTHAGDFGFEGGDPFVKFGHRQRVEILRAKGGDHGIIARAWAGIFVIHRPQGAR